MLIFVCNKLCCTLQEVINIEYITFKNGITFRTTKDHSKWAVPKDLSWICIGDNNRNVSMLFFLFFFFLYLIAWNFTNLLCVCNKHYRILLSPVRIANFFSYRLNFVLQLNERVLNFTVVYIQTINKFIIKYIIL